MRTKKSILFFTLSIILLIIGNRNSVYAQNEFSYRIINENVLTYNFLEKNSKVNVNNILSLKELESEFRFFPILTLKKDEKVKIQAEPRIGLMAASEAVAVSLNELYVQFTVTDNLYLVFGKERVTWGSGHIWNPTNFFIQKDPFRLTNRLEGMFLTRMEYTLPNTSFNLIFSPSDSLSGSTLAAKMESTINTFTYSLSGALLGNKAYQIGADFSLGTDQLTFFGEGILRNYSTNGMSATFNPLTRIKSNKIHAEYIVGSIINLFQRTFFQFEYRYRSDFNTLSAIQDFEELLPATLSAYDPLSMSKHTLYAGIVYRDSYERFNVITSFFYDPVTSQLNFSPGVIYNGDNFKVELNGFLYNNKLAIYDFQTRLIVSFFF